MSKIFYKSIVMLNLLIATVTPAMAQAPELTWEQKVSNMSVVEQINYIAPRFDQSPKLIGKVTWCESSHKVLPHDGGAGMGVTGIHKATFDGWNIMFEKEFGFKLNYESTFDQITMMSYVFGKGESYRNQWTTYVAYANGGTATLFSKTIGYFTVTCK